MAKDEAAKAAENDKNRPMVASVQNGESEGGTATKTRRKKAK